MQFLSNRVQTLETAYQALMELNRTKHPERPTKSGGLRALTAAKFFEEKKQEGWKSANYENDYEFIHQLDKLAFRESIAQGCRTFIESTTLHDIYFIEPLTS